MAATKGVAYFCPKCGGASVEYSALVGGNAFCLTCGWQGNREQLVGHAFEHDFASGEEALQHMMNDLRRLYAQMAEPLGAFLLKWGFVAQVRTKGGVVVNAQQITRYVAAGARATLAALIEERAKMEKERVHDG